MNTYNSNLIKNCIYKGRVFHFRKKPKKHSFKYSVFYLYFDLLRKDEIFKNIPFFSINKYNLFSFYHKDHGPKGCNDLEKWIKKTIKKNNIKKEVSKIFVLTYPRYLGYVFNPISIYTCFDKQNFIIAQIYEVHNTFRQRHFYLIDNTYDKKNHNLKIKKEFHVSPFMGMKGVYNFKSFSKKDNISVFIKYIAKNENLIASFTGKSKELNNYNLLKEFFLLPLMTLKVIFGIHVEALILFIKGLKLYNCPKERKNNLTSALRDYK